MRLDALRTSFASEGTPLLRTDFSSDAAWSQVVEAVTREVRLDPDDPEGFQADVDLVDDPANDGTRIDQILDAWRDVTDPGGYLLVADARSMAEAAGGDPTVWYVDLLSEGDEPDELGDVFGRRFRCVSSEIASIQVNLDLANMDFAEFADHADKTDGVLWGFDDA